ncbi:MAG: trigger factor [Desulfobacterales bacterium]|nr:trigger factor [Desulfobacterales bacterium]
MRVNVEDISTVKKVLYVEIPEEDVNQELDKAYKVLKSNVKIKGFRPGKVPRSILESRFKKDMHAEVSDQLIKNSYPEALKQTKLVPLGMPTIDRPDLGKGRPYHYSATIEVRPPVEDLNVKGLKLKEKVHNVGDEEIQTQLKILQKRQAQLKTVDEERTAEIGDFVLVDYEGLKDGKPFEPAGKTENFLVEVGSGRVLEDFDRQLVGMKPDTTKEFQVRFPDDYYNKDLAGLDVAFKVTLREIKEEVLPDIDDEFAKDLGEYQTLDELKEGIRKELERKYEAQSKGQLREDIIDMLIEQGGFELPEGLILQELSAIVRDAEAAMAYRGISLEDSGQSAESLSEKYRPVAEKRVRQYLLFQKVIEQEGIALSDEVLDQTYEELAEATNQPVEAIKKIHENNKEAYEMFREKALEREAVKWIMENSNIERVEADGQKPEKAKPEGQETETRL